MPGVGFSQRVVQSLAGIEFVAIGEGEKIAGKGPDYMMVGGWRIEVKGRLLKNRDNR